MEALERAAKAIHGDPSLAVEPVIDRDTSGVAGSPEIAATIMEKIAHADVFVPDVSLVTVSDAKRPSPNPNVLLELGFAISELGWDRIVMVMNTAFGDAPQLPFDLRGRRVLQYCLPDVPGDPKVDVRRELERKLKDSIVAVLSEQGSRRLDDEKASRVALIDWAKRFRDDRLTRIGNGEGAAARLSSKHLVCVHAIPKEAISGEHMIDVGGIDERQTHAAPIGSTGYNAEFNSDGVLRVSADGKGALDGYLQLFRSSAVESVDSRMMVGRSRGREDGLPSTFLVMSLGRFLTEVVAMWRQLGIPPPACVFVSLLGLTGVPFMLPEGSGSAYYTRQFHQETLLLPQIVIDDFAADPRRLLRRPLDVLWQTVNEDGCPYFNSDGDWILRF